MAVMSSFDTALANFDAKALLPSSMRSREWEGVPEGITARAFFTSALDKSKELSGLQSLCKRAASEGMSTGDFYAGFRRILGTTGSKDSHDIADHSSYKRAKLIKDMQVRDVQNYANWKVNQDKDLLAEFPCQRLKRIRASKVERDWMKRWVDAGGKLINGKDMVARKDDPVWVNISRFGKPWPPFDFGSGMGVEDVDIDEAVELGLMTYDDVVQPNEEDFNVGLEASLQDLEPGYPEQLKEYFGDNVSVAGNSIVWCGDAGKKIGSFFDKSITEKDFKGDVTIGKLPQKMKDVIAKEFPELAKDAQKFEYGVDADDLRHVINEHGNESNSNQQSLSREDIIRIPDLLSSGEVSKVKSKSDGRRSIEIKKEYSDGTVYAAELIQSGKRQTRYNLNPRLLTKTMFKKK